MRQLNFHNRYGMPVLGIQRHGAALHEPMHDTQLAPADILLVNRAASDLRQLHGTGEQNTGTAELIATQLLGLAQPLGLRTRSSTGPAGIDSATSCASAGR